MIGNIILTAMEIIGTVAFSISGALVAISCGLDLFGVVTVGCITAAGGGLVRDIILNNVPPNIFLNPHILLISVITSLFVFIVAFINTKKFNGLRDKIEHINIVFDALGLAAFSITGVQIASDVFNDNAIIAITMGVITGVGGGLLRDVLVNVKPYILTKHIYAVASILGCVAYYYIAIIFERIYIGTVLSLLITITIRLLAAKFRWKLPKISFDNTENK